MIRLIFLVVIVFTISLLLWGGHSWPRKNLRLDLYGVINSILYFVLLISLYLLSAGEALGLLPSVIIIGLISLRKYLTGRWI